MLAGYLRDGRTGEARQRTGRGERRQRSRVARGRVGRRLRRAGQHDAGRFTRPGVRGNREAGGDEAVAARVDARDARVRERTGRRAALADQVVVQPLRGQEVQPVGVGLRAAAAVVPAGEPGDAHGRVVRRDAAGVRVRLGEREQRVRLALDQQRRRGDPVDHRLGA